MKNFFVVVIIMYLFYALINISYETGRQFVRYDISDCYHKDPKQSAISLYKCVVELDLKRKGKTNEQN